MSKIVAIRARNIGVPLDSVTALSSRQIHTRHYGIIEVRRDDGALGIGFCYVGSGGGDFFAQIVSQLLRPIVLGADPLRVEGLWAEMYQEALLQGRTGTVMRAISAMDTALWDCNARAAGLPLYKYLGAMRTDNVPAYASGGYYLPGKTPAMLAEEMAGYVTAGFNAVKIKVGKENFALEEARLAAVRERIGPDVLLMLDANNAWRDFPTALRHARMFEKYDPFFLEEPFSPDDIDNHVRLARATRIPIATGEIEAGRWRFKELLQSGAAAILQTDAAVCGGITEFRRIAATAASFGVTVCPHWFHDLHVHLVASVPNAPYVEFFPDDKVLNFRRLVSHQLEIRNGHLLLPQGCGLGFDFNEAALERYAHGGWVE